MKNAIASLLTLAAVIIAFGCIATETGNPTFTAASTTNPGALDGALLPDDPMLPATGFYATVAGGPGAITPPTGQVAVFSLEEDQGPATAPIEADGSFRVTVMAASGQWLRLHVLDDDGAVLSDPIDFQVDDTGLVLVDPAPGCASVGAAVLPLSEAGAGEVLVFNDCEAPLGVGSALILGADGYDVITDTPLEIAASESVAVRVAGRDPTGPAILQLRLAGPDERALNVTVSQR